MVDKTILGLGSWRRSKGISLETIAASTKIGVRQLQAIESGDFGRLPGGIYSTNYIRQYASAIGIDETDLLAAYRDFCEPPKIGESGVTRGTARVSRPLYQH